LLEAEGVFDEEQQFSDVEFVTAVQCGFWLEPAEFEKLGTRAFAASAADFRTGKRRFGSMFLRRLFDAIADVDKAFAEHLLRNEAIPAVSIRKGMDPPVRHPKLKTAGEDWPQLVSAALRGSDWSEQTMKMRLERMMTRMPAAPIVLWSFLAKALVKSEAAALKAVPACEDYDPPICKDPQLEGERSLRLHGLWRTFASADTESKRETAMADIRRFHQEESRLVGHWRRERKECAEPDLRAALRHCDRGRDVLRLILDRTPYACDSSPILRELAEKLRRDAVDCVEFLNRQTALLWRRLGEGAERRMRLLNGPSGGGLRGG